MAVDSKCKPFGWQVADLSPIGAAPITGAFITGGYRLFISVVGVSAQIGRCFSADNSIFGRRFSVDNLLNPQLSGDNFDAMSAVIYA